MHVYKFKSEKASLSWTKSLKRWLMFTSDSQYQTSLGSWATLTKNTALLSKVKSKTAIECISSTILSSALILHFQPEITFLRRLYWGAINWWTPTLASTIDATFRFQQPTKVRTSILSRHLLTSDLLCQTSERLQSSLSYCRKQLTSRTHSW